MMNNGTKQHIDAARQVLVGKVPDPKAQVEQITNALIYKFMSDMDLQSVEVGGKASFFVESYEQYAWQKLLDLRLSGQERLDLYVRGLDSMATNPHLPELFRAIMKGAFLPYRDPETLNLFLKEIDWFTYEHSENLGDAYEYLLSVLGSQGSAGQFRTPRHIIDFMVAVMQPQKDEKILDPACGTAGFLISAYKYIEAQHQEKGLTPDEKQKLAGNLVGYDISPDMVRISQVNMYLHNFPDPQIYEYDTLTSEARWDDDFDLIMANPPFMSPKGGIRPHQRFAIQANRSEVLFVDYIMEHLTLHGRAAVIVPEGIIFQSNNAYKGLRKMLVEENYLYAVVSLPAGVFQPYSGVKTSILFMDRDFAKRSDSILFVVVQNDGFDLGAQRNPIEKNDLPKAANIITKLRNESKFENISDHFAFSVKKDRIKKENDFGLSGSKYKDNGNIKKGKWPLIPLGDQDIFRIESGGTPNTSKPEYWGGNIHWVTLVDLPAENLITVIDRTERTISKLGLENSSAKLIPQNSVLISSRATIGRIAINKIELATNQGFKIIIIRDHSRIFPKYLAYMLTSLVDRMQALGTGGTYKEISKSNLATLEIPIPPLEVQQEIVEELDGYQKIIAGARMVVENWKPHIDIDQEWELAELGDVCEINPDSIDPIAVFGERRFTYVDISSIENGTGIIHFDNILQGKDAPSRAKRKVIKGDILLSTVRPNLKGIALLDNFPPNTVVSTGFAVIRTMKEINPSFIYYQLFNEFIQNQMISRMGKGSYPSINQKDVLGLKIYLPDKSLQDEISRDIDRQSKIIKMNQEIACIYESKTNKKIKSIWGR
ncbi:MAG: N-6 DNA methylase [Anaerolineaceae bacterium]